MHRPVRGRPRDTVRAAARDPLKVGDLVLYEDGIGKRAEWPLGRVLALHPGRDGLIRSATIKTAHGETRRPLQKLVLLELHDLRSSPDATHDDLADIEPQTDDAAPTQAENPDTDGQADAKAAHSTGLQAQIAAALKLIRAQKRNFT